ncbi:hypothetical protein PLICRDRAFT_148179 [Plicaturopsis crispa FD-325 SS-3]|uniref:Replication factor C subunit 1 n=1 Tax=Plicaturopsis crispa FD-325 SS-3 TaxID=944288 RepID=A0A0C9T5N3_PLICR|nr:hypothetical protein PLICRDRAFT_148179 [Plicaturopsis crispa FD-325 SS-3]
MAPPVKSTKPTPTPGKDIRAFFGSSQTRPSQSTATPKSTQGLKKGNAIEISDDETKSPRKAKATPSKTKTKSELMDIDVKPAPQPTPRAKKSAVLVSSDDDETPPAKPTLKRKKAAALVSSDEEEEEKPKKPVASSSRQPAKPRQSLPSKSKPAPKKSRKDEYEPTSDEDDFIDDDDEKDKKKKSKPPAKKPAKPNGKDTGEDKPAKKSFDWAAAKAAKLAGPSALGSKEVPNGAPDCLAGLSFVFTGELSAFAREEAVDLAKRYGGRVVGQPSSKTDYVVLGEAAGPSKLAAIKKHNLRTLSEDEFLNLIATRKAPAGSQLDEKTRKKMEKDQEAIKQAAKDLEKREKKDAKSAHAPDASSQLWTTRYAPQTLKEICGNKGQIEKLQQWLHDWPVSLKSGFKKPGKSGMNIFRAVMITGSPGIGKTTSAHLVAKLEGFTPIELNASDARSKRLVENATNISNASLDGWMGGGGMTNAAGVAITDKSCLIMDEVDGMSAGDRGGVGALNALIKKSKVPIICIANDRTAQKLKPLMGSTFNLPFRKPEANAIRSRILSIVYKERLKIPANVVDQLVAGAQSDIRQVLNMLSTWKLKSDKMDFDEGKDLAKKNEKYSMMSPFDITHKMLGPYMFSSTARETLGDKMELYFHDHSFVPLFIQENYLKTQPARVRNLDGPEKVLKQLELMDKAASSISDGDLVDSLIHGPEQHWSLMPLHAVCSTIRPSSFLYGTSSGFGGPNPICFPAWLGQNSKQNKLSRQLGDVQIRMRLKVSGNKSEMRQSYLPALVPHIVKPLMEVGASAVDEVIERMDEYYLSREDWDTVVELGVGQNKDVDVLKKISTATKTALTKKYNAQEHPIPFYKAEDLGKAPKKLAGGPAPDLEDAFDVEEDVGDASDDEKASKKADDISNDKLIKAAKKKKPAAAKKVKK